MEVIVNVIIYSEALELAHAWRRTRINGAKYERNLVQRRYQTQIETNRLPVAE